ncbi:MAG: hypothetical protein GXP41_05535 [Chloroflexi bacterium]|nr:hypothetical protein [Chloroflexota bacterium]
MTVRKATPPAIRWGLLTILFSLFALSPLLQSGYFWGAHDARHSVYFLVEFDRAIQDGVWWPRWAPDFAFGYGYPFFNIYGPLSTYLSEVVHLVGVDFVNAVKVVFGLSVVFSGLSMYGFVRRLTGPAAGFVAAMVYVYAPYHLFDLYVRAALAESVGLIFLPLCLWGFYNVMDNPRPRALLGAGLAYAGLMLTSNLMALLFTPLLGLYVLVLGLGRVLDRGSGSRPAPSFTFRALWNTFVPPALALALGMGLSAIFWLPALAEFRFVRVDQWYSGRYDYHDDFVYLYQLFSPRWGFGISQAGPDDQVSFQLGLVPIVLAIFSLTAVRRLRGGVLRRQVLFFQGLTVAAALLMLPVSARLWEAFRLVSFAQFPWRFQTVTVVTMAILAGVVIHVWADVHDKPVQVLIVGLIVLVASYPFVQARIVPPAEGPVSLAGLMRFQQTADEMTGATVWVKEIPKWSPLADLYIAGKPILSQVDYAALPHGVLAGPRSHSSVREVVEYRAQEPFRLTFNRFYYPGWRAYLLDVQTGEVQKALPIVPRGKLGKMTMDVPAGSHLVLLRFEDTPVRTAGKILSLLALFVAGVLWLWPYRHLRRASDLAPSG